MLLRRSVPICWLKEKKLDRILKKLVYSSMTNLFLILNCGDVGGEVLMLQEIDGVAITIPEKKSRKCKKMEE